MKAHRDRTGFGLILGVIVAFVVTWGIAGIGQMTYSDHVTRSVQTGTLGELATSAALSAIEEAFHQVSRRVNVPGDELFLQLREEVLTEDQVYKRFAIVPEQTLVSILGSGSYRGFELEDGSVSLEVIVKGALTRLSYESVGTLELSAAVRHRASGLRRQVSQTRGFKVALVSTPRPFGQASWLLRNPSPLFERYSGEANQVIARSLDAVTACHEERSAVFQEITDAVTAVNDEIDEINDALQSFGGSRQKDRWDYARLVRPVEAADLVQAPSFSQDVRQPYHFFPQDLILYTTREQVPDLSQLYLPPRVSGATAVIESRNVHKNDRLVELRREIGDIHAKLDDVREFIDWLRGLSPMEAMARQGEIEQTADELEAAIDQHQVNLEYRASYYAGSLQELTRGHADRWNLYRDFSAFFLKRTGAEAAEIRSYDYKFFATREHRSRAFMRFEGPGAVERFLGFLDGAGDRPLNLTVFVDNGDEPLRLADRQLRGKLAIAVSGALALRNLTLADPSNDLLTFHTERQVELSGRVEASIMAIGRVEMEPGTSIHGNLVQGMLPAPERLAGSIAFDARHNSGVSSTDSVKLDRSVVALSPRPSSCVIARR